MALTDFLPQGSIIFWSGTIQDIPDGWQLCDGTNNTPNLVDRFVVGSGNQYEIGDVGGQQTISSVPEHTHAVGSVTFNNAGLHQHNATSNSDGAHNHNTASSGHHIHNLSFDGEHRHEYFYSYSGRQGSNFTSNNVTYPLINQNALSTNVAGGHSHTLFDPGNHSHSVSTEGEHTHDLIVDSGGSHSHTLSLQSENSGESSVNVMPLYYALFYIIKS